MGKKRIKFKNTVEPLTGFRVINKYKLIDIIEDDIPIDHDVVLIDGGVFIMSGRRASWDKFQNDYISSRSNKAEIEEVLTTMSGNMFIIWNDGGGAYFTKCSDEELNKSAYFKTHRTKKGIMVS